MLKKILGLEVKQFLGQGCSRKAFLLENNLVVKLPKDDAFRAHAGSPSANSFSMLLEEFDSNPSVAKVIKHLENGMALKWASKGILTEYLLSLYMEDKEEEKFFAKCIEIKVRKRRNIDEIEIKGIYENAKAKPRVDSYSFLVEPIVDEYSLYDLHDGNLINGYIVDFAALD